MFNSEIKEAFIKERLTQISVTENFVKHLFKISEPYEEKFGKDLSEFTLDEIIDMYRDKKFNSFHYLITINSQYNIYTNWCIKNKTAKANSFSKVNKETVLSCINTEKNESRIVTRETVLEWCESMPNASDAFVILGIFEGICGKNFCELINGTEESVKDGMYYTSTGREVIISDRLQYYINRSLEALEYYSITGSMSKRTPFIPSDLILKEYPNIKIGITEFQKGRRVYNKLARCFSYLGVEYMNSAALTNSGIIDFIKRRCSELGLTTKEYLYGERYYEIEDQFGVKVERTSFMIRYQKYLM